jgi:hypothetical protein
MKNLGQEIDDENPLGRSALFDSLSIRVNSKLELLVEGKFTARVCMGVRK